jgi:hypothetical protein
MEHEKGIGDLIKLIRNYFDRGKRSLLVIFFFCSVFIYYYPSSELKLKYFAPFVFTTVFIIIEILIRLSAALEKKSESYDYIPDEHEAFHQVTNEIRKLCGKRKRNDIPITVKVIGLRGRHVTAWLSSFLGHHKKDDWLVNIHFDYYLIDKTFAQGVDGLEKYVLNIDASAHSVREMSQRCKLDEVFSSKKVSVQLYTYDAVNPFQAFLIGEHSLILSYSMPEIIAGKVEDWIGPERNPYYHYRRDDEQHRFMFDVIERWLMFYGRKGVMTEELPATS